MLISSKEFRDVIEYTRRKPSPVRMYCSRMALSVEAPGVRRQSRLHLKSPQPRRDAGFGDSRVLFLTRGIQNIEQCDLFVDHALLPVRISVTRRRNARSVVESSVLRD